VSEEIIEIFTDGACRGNPGPGGWGCVLRYGQHVKVLSGAAEHTTNNRMELQAAIEGLTSLTRSSEVHLTTDSQYVRKGITEWITGWKKKNWRNSSNQPVKNQDLWQQLDLLAAQHHVTWHWVKGHSGHPENEQADQLANEAIDKMLAGV
jgi:ribonuclease HI